MLVQSEFRLPRRVAQRRGVALLEVATATTVNAALAGLCLAALVAMFRGDRLASERASSHRELVRLADSLRDDVHQATSANWVAASDALQLTMPDNREVQYFARDQRWVRTISESSDGRRAAEQATAFRISDDLSWSVASAETEVGELLDVVWRRDSRVERDPNVEEILSITALVGRDRRLLHEGGSRP